ncbi:hypothetical protein SC171_13310 [Pantoea cypripedii]|uniref:hypothetical protein n=1 Tax=Pantoea cypripedii TaxID=55209 RepID=UPI002FC5B4C5
MVLLILIKIQAVMACAGCPQNAAIYFADNSMIQRAFLFAAIPRLAWARQVIPVCYRQ